ncbi:DUF3604 domain-containing protein [Gammaproteobacteria bacterium]|nr:DUF3604 domain-containing protein [Gammaproteobacteria bacterium]
MINAVRNASRWLLVTLCLLSGSIVSGEGHSRPTVERNPYYGDLHIHTMLSFDAFMGMGSLRTGPDEAYRYAKGEPIQHPSGIKVRLTGPPLDFLAVADHAEYLGAFAALLDPASETYNHPMKDQILASRGLTDFLKLIGKGRSFGELIKIGFYNVMPRDLTSPKIVADAWRKEIEAAERHNDPGKFTAFVGYEYTANAGAKHLHRNVIFKSAEVPPVPFSSLDSDDPEELWNWLDRQRANGIESLSIPHNMNQSDGLAFMETTWKGRPIDRAFAEKRRRNEPIAEISQKKGTSETHPSLSPNDEWADFQIVQYYLNRVENKDPISVFKGGYWRDALNQGLEFDEELGVNPFQFGAIGSSDEHTSAGAYEEDNLHTDRANSPEGRGSAPRASGLKGGTKEGLWEGFVTPRAATWGSGGLAGVWAEENTRASLFDAMSRRETFATSGPRISVRLFGGFGYPGDLLERAGAVDMAYANGVPMGGTLDGDGSAVPSFMVWALRDPNSGWLQRLQIVKGWLDDGETNEKVFDVACSDGLQVDSETHRCPNNGASVDLSNCSVSRDVGSGELKTLWQDPAFDVSQRAYYYARVLENPSCRWSTWDAVRLGIEPNPDLQKTHQERAWSSPIWYQPG